MVTEAADFCNRGQLPQTEIDRPETDRAETDRADIKRILRTARRDVEKQLARIERARAEGRVQLARHLERLYLHSFPAKLMAAHCGLPDGKWSVAFQSRLGKDPWLKPFTDFELERLPKEGVKRLLIMSPACVSDCLETIEELGSRGKESFLGAGGESYTLIPCMNEHPVWISALEKMVRKFAG